MNGQPTIIKKHLYEPNRYNFPKGNLIINPDMNDSNEADQEEGQEKLNVGNPPKKFDIEEYLENISEQCMLQAYKTQSFPTIKFKVGKITQNATPIGPTINNEMTFALPEGYDEKETIKKILYLCHTGVTLKDQSNNGTEYTVKLESSECDTYKEAEQKARELNVEDEENYRRAILDGATPTFLTVRGYNSKQHRGQIPNPSDFPDDFDDSTQDSDYDDPEELQKNKYIAGILYGMHNSHNPKLPTNGVPQFQIEKPDLVDDLDVETIALYGLSLRLNTLADDIPPIRKKTYQAIYNKLILQDYESKEVIKLIAKLDLAFQYDELNQQQDQLSIARTNIEKQILNHNNANSINLQYLDHLITQILDDKSLFFKQNLYSAYKEYSKRIMNTKDQSNFAQLSDIPIPFYVPQSNPILVNNNSAPIIPLYHKFNYANVVNQVPTSLSNNNINYNAMNSKYLQHYLNSNQNQVPVYTPQIINTNNPQQANSINQLNNQNIEVEYGDSNDLTMGYYNQNNQLSPETTITTTAINNTQSTTLDPNGYFDNQDDFTTNNNINETRLLSDQITRNLNKRNDTQNIQTTMISTPTETVNLNTLATTAKDYFVPANEQTVRYNNHIFNNQYMEPNNTISRINQSQAITTSVEPESI